MTTTISDATARRSRRLIKAAVQHSRAGSRQRVMERLFTVWFNGMVYNQIWEDPRVDAEALRLGPGSRVLTISSAGCNLLNYLVHRPDSILAVDLNRHHMSLTRLKVVAMQRLPSHGEFFRFFGDAAEAANVEAYHEWIEPHLDALTRKYWSGRPLTRRAAARGPRIRAFARGFYNRAKMGRLIGLMHKYVRVRGADPSAILGARTLEEQGELFDREFGPLFDSRLVRWLGKLPVSVFNLGIPPSQYGTMREETGGKLLPMYRERTRRLLCDFPIADNYFAWQALSRRYDTVGRRAVPDYLKSENYGLIRGQLGKVRTQLISTIGALKQAERGDFNCFVFLDSQDWMPPSVVAEQWSLIARVGTPGSRIIFRTAGEASPVETALPRELAARFVYHREESRRLLAQDRSAIYGGFHIYEVR